MDTSKPDPPDVPGHPARDVTLVFDMDGTLLDGRRTVVAAVAEGLAATYRHFGLPLPGIDRARIRQAVGLPTPAFYRAAFDPDTVPAEIRDRFTAEFEVRSTRAEVAALHRGETDLYEGTEATLRTLAGRGHPLALFSNANDLYFGAVVRTHRLDRFFGQAISLADAVRRRVARDKTGMVRHLAGRSPAAVVIGDRVHDIAAGVSAGARTVGCLYGFGEPEEFRSADWTIERLPDILTLPLAAPPKR